jgi:hypothetical protein
VAALALALFLRAPGLALPHDRGDQLIWAGVAQNIHGRGLAGYTLRGLEPRYRALGDAAAIVTFACVEGKGALLESYIAQGEKYWDTPVVNQPPGFFLVLLASHALVGRGDDGFPLVGRDPRAVARWRADFMARNDFYPRRLDEIATLPESEREPARHALDEQLLIAQGQNERDLASRLVRSPPRGAIRAQLWATLPVLLADLVTVLLVFGASHALGGRWAALLAGLAWATDPLALYCSERLLSNAPLAAASACALALEAFVASRPSSEARRSVKLAALVGVACAAAMTVKVSAVFLLPAVVFGRWMRGEVGRELTVLLVAALAPVAPWWALNTRVLGHPFGMAWRQQQDWLAVSQWGQLVVGRGPLYYAQTIVHSPFVALGALAGAVAWRRQPCAIAFSLAVLAAAARFDGKEARHLLLAYPPLVVASSVAIAKLAGRARSAALAIAIAIVIGAVLSWQGAAGLSVVLDPARAP